MYPYLTGSASWYLLTLLTQAFGVKGVRGDLGLSPKLLAAQFDDAGNAQVETLFAGRKLKVIYHNPARLEYGSYSVQEIRIDGKAVPFERRADTAILPRQVIASLDPQHTHLVEVNLS